MVRVSGTKYIHGRRRKEICCQKRRQAVQAAQKGPSEENGVNLDNGQKASVFTSLE